jgi:hypothetical protein
MTEQLPPKRPGEIEVDRRVLIAVLVGIALLITGFMALDSRPQGAVEPSPEPTPTPQLVPVSAQTSQGCADGWDGFVNPAFLYELCRPSPWRAIYEGEPRPRLPLGDLIEVRFVDAAALPWPTGIEPIKVVEERSSFDLRIVVGFTPKGCEPQRPLDDKLLCEYQANRSLEPDERGNFHVTIAELPSEAPGEATLHAIGVTTLNRTGDYRSLLEQILISFKRVPADIAL